MLANLAPDDFGPPEGIGGPTFAAVLYVLFTTTLLDFDSLAANCELFMMLPLAASPALYMRAAPNSRSPARGLRRGWWRWRCSTSLTCSTSPLYAAHLAATHRRQPARIASGCAAIGVRLSRGRQGRSCAHGGLRIPRGGGFWFRFNLAYIKEGLSPLEVFRRALVRVSFVVVVASFVWTLGVREAVRTFTRRAGRNRIETELAWLASGWLGVSLLAITVGGRFLDTTFTRRPPTGCSGGPLGGAALEPAPRPHADVDRRASCGLFLSGRLSQPRHGCGEVTAAPGYDRIARYIDAHSRAGRRPRGLGELPRSSISRPTIHLEAASSFLTT